MTHRLNPTAPALRALAIAALLAGLIAAPGCRQQQRTSARPADLGPLVASRAIMLDGRTDDWPDRVATLADEHYLYFRVNVEGQDAPLQAAPEMLALLIDVDGRPDTGARLAAPPEAAPLGVDVMIEFSPRDRAGRISSGALVYVINPDGTRTRLGAADVDLSAAPTHGAPAYEIRMSRHVDPSVAPHLSTLLQSRGRGVAMYTLTNQAGALVGWSDPERFNMPAAAPSRPVADVVVPPKQPGDIRVLSYNVLNAALMNNPSPFARIFQVVQPDIILLQEWDVDEATARAWFTAVVTGEHAWQAVSAGRDVVVVSPHPISRLGPEAIMTEDGPGGPARPVRVVAALVRTPQGDVAAASLHLKCCGTAGSPEDARRLAEARAINNQLGPAFAQSGARIGVIGGDFNLVGTRTPMDMMRMRMDTDGSEMAVASPIVMGDAAMYTWRDPNTPFPPGRLDFMIYTDSTAEVVNAFIIDNVRLTDRALARMGLDVTDTAASDHLPVVVDLRPR